ncbi:hypothetical protein [Roseinatronobacter sp.]|uniref:hypothetical protein n=1 Tax=Roseinatronobacter sp. TaxID=1945755 RepID=UPI003F6FB601
MNYILITSPDDSEMVTSYHDTEMAELYTPMEIIALREGNVIFKNGALHADMLAAARAATLDELVNG